MSYVHKIATCLFQLSFDHQISCTSILGFFWISNTTTHDVGFILSRSLKLNMKGGSCNTYLWSPWLTRGKTEPKSTDRQPFFFFNLTLNFTILAQTFDMYNNRYPKEEPMKYRAGSDKDAFLLESAAISLGFEHVRIIHNATRFEILQWIYTREFTIVLSSFH